MGPRSVFITGASRGLGLEFVQQIVSSANPPKHVFAACRNPAGADELQSLAKQHACLTIVQLDVTKDSDIDSAFELTKSFLEDEGLNLLINNSGIYLNVDEGLLENQTRERMQAHFDTNSTSPLLVCQKFLPLLKKAAETNSSEPMGCSKAAVINISSVMASIDSSLKGQGNFYHYRASKAALNMVTALMSIELKSFGILVAALHPGWVKTDMGGANAHLDKRTSVRSCWSTITRMTEKSTGLLHSYDGKIIPW